MFLGSKVFFKILLLFVFWNKIVNFAKIEVQDLRIIFNKMLEIQKDVSLAKFTTLKIGGNAEFFTDVKNKEEVVEALEFAKKNDLPIFIFSGGSNVIVSDEGFDGMAIRINNDEIELSGENEIIAGAGASLSAVVAFAGENSLSGLEWAVGIPGNLGGAVFGNAGAFGGNMADSVLEVEAIKYGDNGVESLNFGREECGFEYRDSFFKKEENIIILSVKLKLERGDKESILVKMKELIKKRSGQPSAPSPGCIFKNPVVEKQSVIDKFEKYSGSKSREGKIPAGWLIDQIDFRGKKVGGAQISEDHANFIINTGGATSDDMIILISLIKQKVRSKYGIQLQEEVRLLGF